MVSPNLEGRVVGEPTVTLTHIEITCGLNRPDSFRLAIVLVRANDSVEALHCVKAPFHPDHAPVADVESINYRIESLLEKRVD